MERTQRVGDFMRAPVGRYVLGRRHLVFAHSPTLIGFACWGRPDVDDVRELLALCEIGVGPKVAPHRFLADVRGLELIDPSTFTMFLDYTRRHREALGRNIIRQAQLRPDGLVGAVITGFSHLARLPYPERVFGDVEEAIAWLEIEHDEGVALLSELDELRSAATGPHHVVDRIRTELDAAGVLSAAEAARRLGFSTRGLQRALREAGTTYRVELKSFRIRRAQRLLRDSDRSLSWIANEVGFSSAQHFATAYRRMVGDTPNQWRTRARAATQGTRSR